jgi:hypothetical protein
MRSSRSRKRVRINADRNDHELVSWHTKQPPEDLGQEGANHDDPVDARMKQRPGGPPPDDAQLAPDA